MKYTIRFFSVFMACIVMLFCFFHVPAGASVLKEEQLPEIPTRDYMPSSGWVGCMVVPVQFLDVTFEEDPEEMLNTIFIGEGLSTPPSVLTYIQRSSYGALYTDTVVQFPVTMSGEKSAYASDPSKLIDEVLTTIGNRGVTVPTFDENGDGILDGLYLVFAGESYEGTIYTTHTTTLKEGLYSNGVYISNYSMIAYQDFFNGTVAGEYSAITETIHQLGVSSVYCDPEDTNTISLMHQTLGDLDPYAKSILKWNELRDISENGEYELTSSSITKDGLRISGKEAGGYVIVELLTKEGNQIPLEEVEEARIRVLKVENGIVSQEGPLLKTGDTQTVSLEGSSSSILITVTDLAGENGKVSIEYKANTQENSQAEENSSQESSQQQDPENAGENSVQESEASVPNESNESSASSEINEETSGEEETNGEGQESSSVISHQTQEEDGKIIPTEESVSFNGNVKPKKITVPVGISMAILFGGCGYLLKSGSGKGKRRR